MTRYGAVFSEDRHHFLDKLATQVEAYFDKKLQVFDLPLQFTCSDFQQEVYERLKEIPYGNTCAYVELARRLGNPKAVRAVARANAENNFAIIISCHRVLGTNWELTGYSGGAGTQTLFVVA